MTQEEKRLLIIDLCARLPYGVKVQIKSTYTDDEYITVFNSDLMYLISVRSVKPYLRPMSSMTKEERMEYNKFNDFGSANLRRYEYVDFILYIPAFERVDWLNKHHFDYRGLIPMGLALEAPEGMYKV